MTNLIDYILPADLAAIIGSFTNLIKGKLMKEQLLKSEPLFYSFVWQYESNIRPKFT
jgi:hypothetical protein